MLDIFGLKKKLQGKTGDAAGQTDASLSKIMDGTVPSSILERDAPSASDPAQGSASADKAGTREASSSEAALPGASSSEAPSGSQPLSKKFFASQGFWMGVLVFDSLLIAIFGSYVGMRVYQHWHAKSGGAIIVDAKPPKEAPKAGKPEPAKTAKAEDKKPAEPAMPGKPEPAKTAKAEDEKPAEPAIPIKKEPAKTAKAEDKKPAEPAKTAAKADSGKPEPPQSKAFPRTFTLKAPNAKNVYLVGAFLVRQGGQKSMVRGADGTWTLTLYLTPNTYRYSFLVDGKKTIDPENTKVERGSSVAVIYPKL